jgi:hypothetical protein
MKNNIKSIECKFVVHIPTRDGSDDTHLVKELITYKDGSTKPNIRLLEGFKRPFWITHINKRNHQQKKEWEDLSNLMMFECQQSDLKDSISKSLNIYKQGSLKEILSNPYIYGADILSTSIIKKKYQLKYPDSNSPYTVAALDTETDVVTNSGETIIATLAMNDKFLIAVNKSFVKNITNPEQSIKDTIITHLNKHIINRNMTIDIYIANTEIDIFKECFKRLHEWKPDFLAIWNLNYDINKITEACKRVNLDPKHLFSDPALPKHKRFFKYLQGSAKKITASGKVIPINPASQWHTVLAPSSFYVIDSMCVYKQVRIDKPEEPSYALDSILHKELGERKLKFDKADKYVGINWHRFMQKHYKLEYTAYAAYDAIGMLELDEKTKDLSLTLPTFAGISDFRIFNSQPKRIADVMHYFCLERGKVISSVGRKEDIIMDEMDISLSGWIMTLANDLTVNGGIKCIDEDNDLPTLLRTHVSDSDCSAAYPSAILALNVSKATTQTEILDMPDINKQKWMLQNINLTSGHVNAVEYCMNMFNFPSPIDLLKNFK